MLNIYNTSKIVNYGITPEWYVSDIKELYALNPETNISRPLYYITITNRDTRLTQYIHLYREKTIGATAGWYELSCIRDGKTFYQYLSIHGIENIKVLLYHIGIVAIDK